MEVLAPVPIGVADARPAIAFVHFVLQGSPRAWATEARCRERRREPAEFSPAETVACLGSVFLILSRETAQKSPIMVPIFGRRRGSAARFGKALGCVRIRHIAADRGVLRPEPHSAELVFETPASLLPFPSLLIRFATQLFPPLPKGRSLLAGPP